MDWLKRSCCVAHTCRGRVLRRKRLEGPRGSSPKHLLCIEQWVLLFKAMHNAFSWCFTQVLGCGRLLSSWIRVIVTHFESDYVAKRVIYFYLDSTNSRGI